MQSSCSRRSTFNSLFVKHLVPLQLQCTIKARVFDIINVQIARYNCDIRHFSMPDLQRWNWNSKRSRPQYTLQKFIHGYFRVEGRKLKAVSFLSKTFLNQTENNLLSIALYGCSYATLCIVICRMNICVKHFFYHFHRHLSDQSLQV